MEENKDSINLVMAAPVLIERRRLPDEPELQPGMAIVGSFVDGKLIARSVAPEEWTPELEGGLFSTPRQIMYQGTETEDRTVRAQLMAIIPAADLPREPWQPEPEEDAAASVVMLGVVVRLPGDRQETELQHECLSHFMNVMGGNAEPVVDRILKSL